MGGQTALNCALALEQHGVLKEFGVEMIGATADAIDKAEDRSCFDKAMRSIGLECPVPASPTTWKRPGACSRWSASPSSVPPLPWWLGRRHRFTTRKSSWRSGERGLDLPDQELLIDESLIGWKEYEMEVVRIANDNCIIVCAIENFDPMGIHTGDLSRSRQPRR